MLHFPCVLRSNMCFIRASAILQNNAVNAIRSDLYLCTTFSVYVKPVLFTNNHFIQTLEKRGILLCVRALITFTMVNRLTI